jgi:hypothetical protein
MGFTQLSRELKTENILFFNLAGFGEAVYYLIPLLKCVSPD